MDNRFMRLGGGEKSSNDYILVIGYNIVDLIQDTIEMFATLG